MIAARDILGNAEVRRLCGGVTRATLIRWRTVGGFPDPIRRLECGELWDRRQVKAWREAWVAAGSRRWPAPTDQGPDRPQALTTTTQEGSR